MEELLLGLPREEYERRGAFYTAKEIEQQPELLRKLADELEEQEKSICQFMEAVMAIDNLRIILTGAGSSAFVGEAMANLLAGEGVAFPENIHTTDIVGTPDMTLRDCPTLLISYARSGESPESQAAIEFARKRIGNLYQVVIVCGRESTLARTGAASDQALVLVMPEGSNDRGFAMTSSVSCMAAATWCLFHFRDLKAYTHKVRLLADAAERNMMSFQQSAGRIAGEDYRRLIFLGLGALRGLAREGAVKSMELTNGYVHAGYDTPTGFRHGPKTVLDDTAMTVHFVSPDSYSAQYDTDFIREMIGEQKKNKIVTVKRSQDQDSSTAGDFEVLYELPQELRDEEMGAYLMGLLFLQLLSLDKSLELGYTSDNPCADGSVNRVVQGVIIHPLPEQV